MSWFKKARDPYEEFMAGQVTTTAPPVHQASEDEVTYCTPRMVYRTPDGRFVEDLGGPEVI